MQTVETGSFNKDNKRIVAKRKLLRRRALRLSRIFAAEHLGSYPFYIEVDPESNFDIEYLGGQWHEELIDGVQFFFPASDGNKLGVVEVWGSGCVMSAAVRGRPGVTGSQFARTSSIA